jgi:hypothetical protein
MVSYPLMKKLLLIGLVIFFQSAYGQLAHPYKVYSENGQYFVKSIPFSDQVWTVLGKTSIYAIGDTTSALFVVDRYFSPDYLFLANDGQSLFYLTNWVGFSVTDQSDILTFYHNAKLLHRYKLKDFQLADSMRIHSVLYNSYNEKWKKVRYPKVNRQSNSHVAGDVLTLFVEGELVYQFSMRNGTLQKTESFKDFFRKNSIIAQNRKVVNIAIDIPTQFGVPKLANGKEFWEEMEKTMDVTFLEGDNEDYEQKYKQYNFELNIAIDSNGNCIEARVDMEDSVYKDEIVRFFRSARFDKSEIPDGIEKWYFHYITGFRNKSKPVAEEERKREIEKEEIEYLVRIKQDSIDHIYIPSNIDDCFLQLNKIMSYTAKKEFAAKKEHHVIGEYHLGLGLLMRNNWGLWNGSRLSHYFNELGVSHPESMSSVIMISYHRYLNKKDIRFQEQLRSNK